VGRGKEKGGEMYQVTDVRANKRNNFHFTQEVKCRKRGGQ